MMYICRYCGNKENFIELNVFKTYVTCDSDTGEVKNTDDKFLCCDEVICGVCGATSSDSYNILYADTNEPIQLGG